jgi:hypothetical protein
MAVSTAAIIPVALCATFSMAPLDLPDHLLNFVAPAFSVGFMCAALGRLAMRRAPGAPAWWVQGAINFAVGVAVLAAGLIIFGRDGKMATYAALVAACGTSQWLVAGGWRR